MKEEKFAVFVGFVLTGIARGWRVLDGSNRGSWAGRSQNSRGFGVFRGIRVGGDDRLGMSARDSAHLRGSRREVGGFRGVRADRSEFVVAAFVLRRGSARDSI